MTATEARANQLITIGQYLLFGSIAVSLACTGALVVTENGYWGIGFWIAAAGMLGGFLAADRGYAMLAEVVESEVAGRLDG